MIAVLDPAHIQRATGAAQQQAAESGWSPRIDAIRQRWLAFADSQPRGEHLRLVTESLQKTEAIGHTGRRATV